MTPTLDRLSLPSGKLAMVAMDQRESLRSMLRQCGNDASPEAITRFKLAVARAVAPHASGFLVDGEPAFDEVTAQRVLPDGCGLVLAADELDQPTDGAVRDTTIDRTVDPAAAKAAGVVALKLLVIWKRDADVDRRVAMSAEFVAMCRAAGLLSVLEPVAQPTDPAGDWDLDEAILDAASALRDTEPDLYKAQVPGRGKGSISDIAARSEKLDGVLRRPWVVLSNGVEPDDFPDAVEAACRGGASGMLAGRAVWTAALGSPDPAATVATVAVDRLLPLIERVERYARPLSRP